MPQSGLMKMAAMSVSTMQAWLAARRPQLDSVTARCRPVLGLSGNRAITTPPEPCHAEPVNE